MISSRVFPDILKLVEVILIHIKNEIDEILNVFSEVVEILFLDRMVEFLVQFNLL